MADNRKYSCSLRSHDARCLLDARSRLPRKRGAKPREGCARKRGGGLYILIRTAVICRALCTAIMASLQELRDDGQPPLEWRMSSCERINGRRCSLDLLAIYVTWHARAPREFVCGCWYRRASRSCSRGRTRSEHLCDDCGICSILVTGRRGNQDYCAKEMWFTCFEWSLPALKRVVGVLSVRISNSVLFYQFHCVMMSIY